MICDYGISWSNFFYCILMIVMCLTSQQQLRLYGDATTSWSLVGQTVRAGDRTQDPWVQGNGLSTTVHLVFHGLPK